MSNFHLMYEYVFDIDTTGNSGTPSWARMAEGFINASPSNNEELAQDKYLDGEGFGEADVIGAQQVITFTGHRSIGNAAQDYIFGKVFSIGPNRRSRFRMTDPSGNVVEAPCTIANIQSFGGDAGAKAEVSVEIHLNGLPTLVTDTTAPTVTVSPIDGATGIAVTSNVVWTFSEEIQGSTVNDANFFVTKADGTAVTGSLVLDSTKKIVTFDPTANLTALTDYIAVATKSVKDVAGNALAANSVTNFRTA